MKQAMRKMGVQQQDLDVKEVIFKMAAKNLIISNPAVSKINMMGQETYQVVGEVHESKRDVTPDISEADIQMVVDQANCSKEKAVVAVKKAKGDLAEAIMSLMK